MKKYQTAKELLATKAENKEKKPIYATRKLSIGLVSCMLGLLMAAPIARAEEVPPAPGVEAAGQQEAPAKVEEAPAKVEEDLLTEAEIKEIKDRALNLGDNKYVFTSYRVDELKERLRKIKAENPDNFAKLKKEAIDNAIIEFSQVPRGEEREIKTLVAPSITGTLEAGDESISVKFAKNQGAVTINKLGGDFYAYVNVNGIDNIIKLKYITRSFKIKLTAGLKVDKQVSVKIVVTEKNNNRKILGESPYSNKVTVAKKPDPMDQTYKDIVIPKTTVYVNSNAGGTADYEIKKAIIAANKNIEAYKNIGDDLKKVTYKAATQKATLKFRDKKELEIDVSSITVADVVASKDAVVNKVTVGDTTITGKLDPYIPGTKVNIYLTDGEVKPNDAIQITVDNEGNFTYQVPADKQDKIGKVLKGFKIETIEPGPGKKESVKLHRVQPKTPEITDVRDPGKLTEEEKKAVIEKIKQANKDALPKGTGQIDGEDTLIDFDENGTVRVLDPNIVEVSFPGDVTTFEKDSKGLYKIKEGKEDRIISFTAKEILNDLKPYPPTITANDDKLTFAPNSLDTDANIITITYKDKKNQEKTAKVTKTGDSWKSDDDNVKIDNGVISLATSSVLGGSNVTATVTDNADQTSGLTRVQTAESVNPPTVKTKAVQITELGGLDPVVMKKWVGDVIGEGFWKDGVKVKEGVSAENKKKIDDLLAGAKFDDFQDDASKPKRNTDTANNTTGFVGKIKVKFDDGSELVVENQTLYVSDHVTWFSKEKTPGGEVVFNKNTPDDAIVAEFKLGKGTKIDNADGKTAIEGEESPVSYQKYKVKPGTDLKTYVHPTLQSTIYESINKKVKEQDDFIDSVWNTDNFKVTDSNKVFTATATEAFKVTVNPNGGTKAGGGEAKDIVTKVKKNGTYKLPAANTFAPPNENQEFAGWMVGKDTNLKQPNSEITINGNTEINAIWKAKEYKVRFVAGDESIKENMAPVKAKKGEYELPSPTFTPPAGKEFAGWSISRKPGVYSAGARIQISEDVTLTATWKPKSPGSSGSGSGTGTGTGSGTGETTTPGTTPEPSQPGNTPDPTPGSENPTEDKPKTPNVEKGDKVINVGDKEVVVPKVVVDKKKGKLDKEERTKIEEKIKQKNPDVVDVKIDEKANAFVTFNDGRRERILAKDLVSKEGFVIPRRDRHSQDESPNRRRAGKNVKTGVESIAGIACTLVASTGALYIGRKKED